MQSCELVTFVSAVACTIGNISTSDELGLLGAIFTQLGDTLTTMSIHHDFCCSNENSNASETNSGTDCT